MHTVGSISTSGVGLEGYGRGSGETPGEFSGEFSGKLPEFRGKRRPTERPVRRIVGVGCWILDARFWMLDACRRLHVPLDMFVKALPYPEEARAIRLDYNGPRWTAPHEVQLLCWLSPHINRTSPPRKAPPIQRLLPHAPAIRASSSMTATLPSASPFSKSPSVCAMQFVTCARHNTRRRRAVANA